MEQVNLQVEFEKAKAEKDDKVVTHKRWPLWATIIAWLVVGAIIRVIMRVIMVVSG